MIKSNTNTDVDNRDTGAVSEISWDRMRRSLGWKTEGPAVSGVSVSSGKLLSLLLLSREARDERMDDERMSKVWYDAVEYCSSLDADAKRPLLGLLRENDCAMLWTWNGTIIGMCFYSEDA